MMLHFTTDPWSSRVELNHLPQPYQGRVHPYELREQIAGVHSAGPSYSARTPFAYWGSRRRSPFSASGSLDPSTAGFEPASPASCVRWESNPHADRAAVFETATSTVPSQTHWGGRRVSISCRLCHRETCFHYNTTTITRAHNPHCTYELFDCHALSGIRGRVRIRTPDFTPLPVFETGAGTRPAYPSNYRSSSGIILSAISTESS